MAPEYTSIDEEELLRRQLEEERRAREEAAKAEKEAAEQTAKAQEEAAEATAAAEEQAKAAQEQANQQMNGTAQETAPLDPAAPINPAAPETPDPMYTGVRSGGMGRVTAQDKLDAQFMREEREAIQDTRFKVNTYDTVEGYDQSKNKAHLTSMLVGHAADLPTEEESGNEVAIDYRSIHSKEQAYALMMVYSDDKAKVKGGKKLASALGMDFESFLAEAENYMYDKYGRNVFSTPYSPAAKNRAYTAALNEIGLTDVAGNVLDLEKANPADVFQACRMDPSGATADAVYAVVQKMTKVPGNPWYGMSVDKDMFAFVESSELTKADYNDHVKNINQSFTYSNGYTDDNMAAYMSLYDDIQAEYGENKRVAGYLVRELNKSFADHTGMKAPTREQAERALAETESMRVDAVNGAKSREEAREGIFNAFGDWLSGGIDWLKNLGSAETKASGDTEGEESEYTTVEQIIKDLETPKAGGAAPIMGGGTASVNGMELDVSKPIASAGEMPPRNELFPAEGQTGEFYGPVQQEGSRLESRAYDPNMTGEQAWMAHQAGYTLDPRNEEMIARWTNPEISGVVYGSNAASVSAYLEGGNQQTPGASAYGAKASGVITPDAAVHGYRKYGAELGKVANSLAASNLKGEARASAECALMDIAADLFDMAATPYGASRPAGTNLYDYGLSQNPELLKKLKSVDDLIKQANGGYSENVVNTQEERDARMLGYQQAAANGTATPEMLSSMADYYAQDWVDVEADEWRNELVGSMNGRGSFFAEDGLFWQGESMAAIEGRNIRTAGGMQGFADFSQDLQQATQDVIDSYTTAAHNIGMSLKEYLGSAGITGIDQLADIAYNGMQSQGRAILEDEGLRTAINAAHDNPTDTNAILGTNKLRFGDQVGLGAEIGVIDYAEGFAQASYMMMDMATYDVVRQSNKNEYRNKYGAQASAIYRRDLNEMIASGMLSQEMAEELRANMDRAYNIFDVGYEIDPNGLKGFLRQTQAELGKRVELLQAVKGTLVPEQQRIIDFVSSGASSLTGMAVNAATMGAGKLLGAGATVSRVAGAIAGTGMNAFEDAYDQNVHVKGMSSATAAKAAFGEAAAMTIIEHCTPDSMTGVLFGDAAVDGARLAARKNLPAFARATLGWYMKENAQEGLEEGLQTLTGGIFDLMDSEWQAYDRGEGFSVSRLMKTMENGLRETDYAALGKEVLTSFGGGFAMGAVFNLFGVAGGARMALKDAQAFRKYESVSLATQIAEGTIEATDENLGRLHSALRNDLNDPAFCRYIDKSNVQATKDRQVMTAMLEGVEADTLYAATDHAAKAKEYEDKAKAASTASDTAKSRFFEIGERVENGQAKPSEMDDALAQWQKAQTAYTEAKNAANKEADAASRDTKVWLKACQERGNALTSEGMKVRMNQIASMRMGLAKRLDVLYSAMEDARVQYGEAVQRDAAAQREVDYAEGAVFSEEAEIDEELAVMADDELDADIEGLTAQIAEAAARVADVSSRQEELGIGGDTVQALVEQEIAPLSKRKERIIAREKGRFNDAFDRMQQALEMDNEDAANEIQAEYDGIAARLQSLGVDTDALTMEQYGIAPEEANAAYEAAQEQEAQRAADEEYGRLTDSLARRMEATSANLEAINPARRYFAQNKIYVNESQAADILATEGLKSISQFNRRYHTQLTTKESDGAMPLDGHVLSDINAEAAGSVNVDGDPVAEMLRVMQTGKELTATQRAEKAEAKELEDSRKQAEAARRERVKDVVTGTTKEQRESPLVSRGNVDAVATSDVTPTADVKGTAEKETDQLQSQGGLPQTPSQKQAQRNKKLEGSALKAVQNLAKEMKVGLRVKSRQRFNSADARMGKGVLGYYKNGQRNAIVRSADAGRVSVTGHEIGHSVQEQLGITSNSQMINSWQNTFGNTGAYSPQQYDHEAFAEFFWRYLTGRDAAVAYAGDAYVDTFEQALRQKKLNKQVAKAQAQVSAYWNSEAEAKIRSRIVNAYDSKTPEDTAFARRVEIRLADDTAAAEDFQDVIRKRTGEKHLSLEDNLRDTIRFNRRASSRANECLTKALVDQNGDVVGESLKGALSDIKGKDFDLFWEYELAKHSLDRDTAKGSVNQVFDEDTLSTADRKALVAKIEQEHPEFKKANERFQQWRRLFMDTYLVNNGFLGDPAQASLMMDALDAAYPNYVPTYRPKNKSDRRATVGGKIYQMRTATGSTEDVINPFDSFVSMVNSIVQMTADNDSRKKFADLYDRYGAPLPGETGPGVGLFANEITQDMQRVSVSTESMRERITKMLDALGTDPDVIMQIGDIIGDEKVEYHGTGRVNMNNVITVRMDDGSKRYFEVYNPELYELLANTNAANRPGILDGIAKATRMMSMLTTGSNPVFGLTNAMRDFQNSVNYGSWAASYTDGAVKWLGALWDVVTNGEASKEYDSLGGGGWTAFDTNTKKGSEQIRGEVVKGYNRSNVGRFGKMVGRKIWSVATMSKLNEAIEKTSRLAEYKYGKHDLTTTEGRIEAFLAAQDVTTDFSRRGNGQIARDLKNLVPFFNASTQGIYRNARQFSAQESDRAGIRFAKNVVNSALASALANGLLLSYLDDDEKEEFFYLSDDLKAKHMFLPNFAPDVFGDAALIRIPLDQNPVSYAVNAAVANFFWEGESDNEFVIEMSAVANVIKDNLNPVGSTILDPAISMLSNKNWYGSDIVPSYLESYDETNQYTEETPTPFVEISKGLSDVGIKVSPMMLQYMAEQYTGYIGQTIIPALPSEKNQDGIAAGLLNALVATARKRVTSDPLKSNDVVSTVYDSYDEMNAVYKAGKSKRDFEIDYFRSDLTDRERRRAINEADDLIHSGGDIYEAKKDISAGYDRIDQINDRDDLTDEEKHTLIQKIRRDMVETALDVQEVMNDYNTRYKDNGIVKQFMTWLFS